MGGGKSAGPIKIRLLRACSGRTVGFLADESLYDHLGDHEFMTIASGFLKSVVYQVLVTGTRGHGDQLPAANFLQSRLTNTKTNTNTNHNSNHNRKTV